MKISAPDTGRPRSDGPRRVVSVISRLTAALICLTAVLQAHGLTINARDCGAAADGVQLDTKAIQAAVDKCSAAGGGTVLLAGGRFLSGTIYLRNDVTIEIAAGATLLGSTNLAHYPVNLPALRSYTDTYVNKSLIAGENLKNIGLIGRGTIDGQGSRFGFTRRMPPFEKDRPYLIRLVNCQNIRVEGLRLQDSAMWMQHYLGCERVTLRGLHVTNYRLKCNDGIDLDGCKDANVSGCLIETEDDGITLKSSSERPCENVVISDCIVRSHASAIKLGTESNGGFRNITIVNCVITSLPPEVKVVNQLRRGMSGIALQLLDGGVLERIAISNISIHGVTSPLFLWFGNRARPIQDGMPTPPIGAFRDVVINNIVATGVDKIGCSIIGQPGHPIENVLLSNLTFTFDGGGDGARTAQEVPELPQSTPECFSFGELPAYGFFVRHVNGLRFSNVQLRTSQPDLRHAMVFDDVENLAVDGLDAAFSAGAAPLLSLRRTRGALIRGCQPHAKGGTFIKLTGAATRQVTLMANDLTDVAQPTEVGPDVPAGALSLK